MEEKINVEEWHAEKSDKTYVEWIYGKTGTGKTRMIKDIMREKLNRHEITTNDIGWMEPVIRACNYSLADILPYNKVLIIDNLYPEEYTLRELIGLISGTTVRVKMRGYIPVHPEEVYITSLWRPEELYPNADELLKRITKIVHL